MLTLSAFASLAQFGAGISFAFTFFLEPISARERQFKARIEQSLYLVPNDQSDESEERKSELWEKMIALDLQVKSAKAVSKLPLLLLHIGTCINLLILIAATIAPEGRLSLAWVQVLFTASLLPTLLGAAALVIIAKRKIKATN
ncbi:MAG: hypothetical protein MK104_06420 [Erythrobacter sp.]|uniref:hypothetical protein n=1 Tax=Qipengyuania pacifica TaxID=2860199 RepID=UPI0035C79D98|nr:hypothetical protein [Erythrobacter sp.]